MPDDAAMPPLPRFCTEVPRGRVLVFAPHPDDEVAGPGGVLALHARAGDPVRVIVSTDGTSGDPDGRFDRAAYAEMRHAESRAGLRFVGVDDVELVVGFVLMLGSGCVSLEMFVLEVDPEDRREGPTAELRELVVSHPLEQVIDDLGRAQSDSCMDGAGSIGRARTPSSIAVATMLR